MKRTIVEIKRAMKINWCLHIIFIASIQLGLSHGSIYDGDEWSEWSDWTPCSRTCDGGVTQQFRRCRSLNGCHGVSIRRKMCNMQTCTEDRDYRGDQCRAFNGVRYRGEKRTWEAIEDPENPCSLTCRAEGTDLLAKLSPKVRDGTRCRSGSLHVCVEGRCEVVGCDLKLGSPKKIDACGVCGGDSRSCISSVYQWEVVSIKDCSANCGGGTQAVTTLCKNSLTGQTVDDHLCNSATKPKQAFRSCNIQPCQPEWETGEWSQCSTSCGGGLKTRKVICAQQKNETKIQVAEKLCHHIRKPSSQEQCNPETCPYWHAGSWSPCSATCGQGFKTRSVICRDGKSFFLPPSRCEGSLKPDGNSSCFEPPCLLPQTTPTVVVSSSSSRSPSKKRRVSSRPDPHDPPTDLTPVLSTTMRAIEEEKSLYPTKAFMEEESNIMEEEELPREHTLPLIQPYPPMDNAVLFDHNAIPSEPTFVAEEWGPCNSTCGDGFRKREVKCKIFLEFSRTIANLPDKECPGPKPVEEEPCYSTPCQNDMSNRESVNSKYEPHYGVLADSDQSGPQRKTLTVGLPLGTSSQDMTFSWRVFGYSPCSASCLGGVQEAIVHCVRDYDQRVATPALCMDKPAPDIATTRTCNDHPCPPRWNVSQFGPCSKTCGGGVMIREVSCIHEVTIGNTVVVPNSICPSPVPRTEVLCNAVNCPPFWESGEWTRCSKRCGGGTRTRVYHCKQVSALGQVVDLGSNGHHCTQPKPSETKPCNRKPCEDAHKKASHNGPHSGRNNGPDYKKKVSVVAKGRVTVYDGVLLKLRCPLSKDMKGSVSWMKGPEYLNILPSHMEFVQKTASLKIKNTTLSDSGVYTCNFNGRPTSNVTVHVLQYSGYRDKSHKSKSSMYESTLYADQQEGGVSVSMSNSEIITPNSKTVMFGQAGLGNSPGISSPNSFLLFIALVLSFVFSRIFFEGMDMESRVVSSCLTISQFFTLDEYSSSKRSISVPTEVDSPRHLFKRMLEDHKSVSMISSETRLNIGRPMNKNQSTLVDTNREETNSTV